MIEQQYSRLPLEGAYNVRELGGYPSGTGVTKWRAFLRADDLGRLTMADMTFLKEYGLVAVIDLRSASELLSSPDPYAEMSGVNYLNMPLMTADISAIPDLTRAQAAPSEHFLRDSYLGMIQGNHTAIARIFEFIAGQPVGCILFHCTAGKDRTGVLAALLLGVAGVGRADILANYSLTYIYLRENQALMGMSDQFPVEFLYSKFEYMEPTVNYILDECGGFRNYLQKIGVASEVIDQVAARLG